MSTAPMRRSDDRAVRRTSFPTRTARFALVALAIAGAGSAATNVAAQAPGGSGLLVEVQPDEPLVGIAILFPVGSARDPQGGEGTAFLLGRVLEEEGGRRVAPLGARMEVEVTRDGFLVSLAAPASGWEEAWRTMGALLGDERLPEELVGRVRQEHRSRLVFEAGAPVRSFQLERDRLLLGEAHPGARGGRGTPDGLGGLDAGALARFRADHLRMAEALGAIVGPVSIETVRAVTGRSVREVVRAAEAPPEGVERAVAAGDADTLGVAAPPRDTIAPDPAPRPPGAGDPAGTHTLPPAPRLAGSLPAPLMPPSVPDAPAPWTTGDRRIVDRDVTSTWISVAWPLPAGTPVVLQEFLAHVVSESLNPSPPDPGLYAAEARIERVDGAPILLVDASVDPRVTVTWEARILAAVEGISESPPQGAFFELARRRYRSGSLMGQAVPEARARWLVLHDHGPALPPDLARDVWALSREGLAALAGARGEARILLYGPARMMDR